jgi:hypothetical protein
MHIRVTRFTDVDPERLDGLVARIEENDGPPEGVPSSGVKVLHDESQGTAVVLGMFDSEEDMRAAEEALNNMPSEQTPGSRETVDRCVVRIEKES